MTTTSFLLISRNVMVYRSSCLYIYSDDYRVKEAIIDHPSNYFKDEGQCVLHII